MALYTIGEVALLCDINPARYARDATFLKINEDRPGAPIFKGWTDNSFSMSTNFDGFRL
ncbi:hypothetical protein MMT29_12555 [Escherichia coli]|nr:hypothetical protein [Escherichia coli]